MIYSLNKGNKSRKYLNYAAANAKSLQSCPTLCDPIDGSPPGSPVPVILQARIPEWVAISFSNAWKWKVKVNSLSCVRLLATPWTAAYQGPPSMGFSRQEYWSGMPLPSQVTNTTIYVSIYVFWLIAPFSMQDQLTRIEPMPPAVEAWSLNHCISREDPQFVCLFLPSFIHLFKSMCWAQIMSLITV